MRVERVRRLDTVNACARPPALPGAPLPTWTPSAVYAVLGRTLSEPDVYRIPTTEPLCYME